MPDNDIRRTGIVRHVPKILILIFASVVAGVVGASLNTHFGKSAYTISFADFVAVMLSAITLLMTLLGFILALLAFIGWRDLNDRVDRKVEHRTNQFLEDGFKDGNHLHAMLQNKSKQAAYKGVEPLNEHDVNEYDQDYGE